MVAPSVQLVRLTEVSLEDVVALLNEPRLRRHMPLSTDVTRDQAAAWVQAKDGQWETNGYGPWAVLVDRAFAGWAGFQAEPEGADLAVVLLPEHWGLGLAVTRAAIERGFEELGLPDVLVSLPPTRSPERAMGRLGFERLTDVVVDGETFLRFRLTRESWRAATTGPS